MNKNKNTEKKYALCLDADLAEKIRYISDFTKRTQISLIREYIDSMMSIASTFKSANFMFYNTGNDSISINWYGRKAVITLINQEIE